MYYNQYQLISFSTMGEIEIVDIKQKEYSKQIPFETFTCFT